MALYETTIIVRQDLSQQDAEKIADNIATILQENNGKVVSREYWGLLNLAYLINKNRKGHYYFLCIDADYAALTEMQRRIGLNENILRELTIKVDEFQEGQSPILVNSEEN